jgi:hypothetical protein
VKSNPTYYDVDRGQEAGDVSRLVDEWFRGGADEYGSVASPLVGLVPQKSVETLASSEDGMVATE